MPLQNPLSFTMIQPTTFSPIAGQFLTGFNQTTGLFSSSSIPSGTVTWNQIGSANGNLTLNNANFTTTFNQTSAVPWVWANTTPATNPVGQSSPILTIQGRVWTAGADTADTWTIQDLVSTTNDRVALTVTHTSGGTAAGTAMILKPSVGPMGLFIAADSTAGGTITASTFPLGTALGVMASTANPQILLMNGQNDSHPTGVVQWMGSAQSRLWGIGSLQYCSSDQFEFFGGTGGNVNLGSAMMTFARATAYCAIGRGQSGTYASGTTLTVFDQLATTGATQLLIQGGAADTTSNVVLRVNKGGTTTATFSVSASGLVTAFEYLTAASDFLTGNILQLGNSGYRISAGGFNSAFGFSTGIALPSSAVVSWNADTGISRTAAGVLAIGNGVTGNASGNLSLNRINKGGVDFAGQATITAGATTQAVVFAANYAGTGQPVIVLTPTSDPLALGAPVGYWVTYAGSAGAWTGFTVNIQAALAGNVTFNYLCVGQA